MLGLSRLVVRANVDVEEEVVECESERKRDAVRVCERERKRPDVGGYQGMPAQVGPCTGNEWSSCGLGTAGYST